MKYNIRLSTAIFAAHQYDVKKNNSEKFKVIPCLITYTKKTHSPPKPHKSTPRKPKILLKPTPLAVTHVNPAAFSRT